MMHTLLEKFAQRLLIALLGLLVFFLSGCGLAATPEPVTIKFTFSEADIEFYEPLVPVFQEAHPHITVALNPVPQNLLDTFTASRTDVIALDVFALKALQQERAILGLNSVIEEDNSFDMADYYPGTVDYLAADGETWAIPVGIDLEVMYFNRDLFDQHGLPYPELGWDWDDFLTYALTISDPEAPVDKRFGYTITPGFTDAYMFVYQHGGKLFNDTLHPSEATFNDPLTVEALEFYASLFHTHDVAPTPAEVRKSFGGNHQYAVFDTIRRGNVGMWIMPVSQQGGLSWPVEWEMNWDVAPLPEDAARFAAFRVEEGYAIFAGTANPDACWEWITFVTRRIHPRLIPARRSLVTSELYDQTVGDNVAAVVRQSLEFATPLSLWQWMELGPVMNPFNQAVEDIVEGDSTPQEALDWAQDRAESMMP